MSAVVVDACVVIDALVFDSERGQSARAALARYVMVAPAILTGEVLSAVSRQTRHQLQGAAEPAKLACELIEP